MDDLKFIEDPELRDMYFTSKATFLPEDYVALGILLSANLPEEMKAETLKTLMDNALDRYIAEHGTHPYPTPDFSL